MVVKFAQRYQVGNRKYEGTAADRRSSLRGHSQCRYR
jgi:hypothetical protein